MIYLLNELFSGYSSSFLLGAYSLVELLFLIILRKNRFNHLNRSAAVVPSEMDSIYRKIIGGNHSRILTGINGILNTILHE